MSGPTLAQQLIDALRAGRPGGHRPGGRHPHGPDQGPGRRPRRVAGGARPGAGRHGHRPESARHPAALTAGEVKGFGLAATRVMLDGGVAEMLDLARANLRNIPRPSFTR